MKNIPKVRLFLNGILNRLDAPELFVRIECILYSGTKEFPLNCELEEGELSMDYLGTKRMINRNELGEFLLRELPKYDKLLLHYIERANTYVLNGDEQGVRTSVKETAAEKAAVRTASVGGREYIIRQQDAPGLLRAIGIVADNGKIKNDMIRKYNQIDRFVELVSDISMPKDRAAIIMDCACGKSYLSFALNYYFTELRKLRTKIIGVDYNQGVIKSSKLMAEGLRYYNMEFLCEDLRQFDYGRKIDLLISLHGCDIATDYAIYSGIKHKAGAIVVVPCCHKELAKQIAYDPFESMMKHGIFKRRFCDVLTDSLRVLLLEMMGYKVSVLEYVSPLDTPKNIMLKAVRTSGYNAVAKENYLRLKEQFHVHPTLEMLLCDYLKIKSLYEDF
ncbi:SAM-dependent methyltransferase [Acetivibrio sp. MSJd-27]|uniref:class I SAM-dependent methyltransferase n=1 Tax=Acetivibrio sp. MSJd-27 TaxID=2841523 RepID=UPI001C10E865|nr:SAM-dependent methyltransferase [Acetivibrio sp. MSJd-27]MBU5451160.1 SAM-dependent methyltransferase [Acetivibrio sp. MSJd-27]